MKTPLIEGRFVYNPEDQVLRVVFTSGRSVVLRSGEDKLPLGAAFEKGVRGEVKIADTGGRAAAKSELTWAQQLEGTLDAEVRETRRVITPEPRRAEARVRRYDARGRMKLSLSDLDDLTPILADIVKKEEAA